MCCVCLLWYMDCSINILIFFFKQKTAYEMRISDLSSDVCSSDLRHIGADVAVAVAVGAGRTDEILFGQRQLHLVDDVRLGRDDQRLARKAFRELQYAAGRSDIIGMVDDMRRAFGVRGDRKSVVSGQRVSVRVALCGRGDIKQKKIRKKNRKR